MNTEVLTINQLYGILQELTGSPVEPEYGPSRTGDVRHSLADIGKARTLLAYEPEVGVREGLVHTVAWMREHLGVS